MSDAKEPSLHDVVEQLKTNSLLLAAFIKASGKFEDEDLFILFAHAKLSAQDIATVTGKATHTVENKLSELRRKDTIKISARSGTGKEAKK